MKKLSFVLLSFALFSYSFSIAQEETPEEKKSKFGIIAYGGIGYGVVENDNQPNYNLNSNSGEILLNYKFHENFGIAAGVGYNELSGNGFNAVGNFYHKRDLLKIPVLGTLNYPITDKIKVIGNFGFFTQHIIRDEFSYLNNVENDVFEGWNFGMQLGLGFAFEIAEGFYGGINFNGQSDFNKFQTSSNATFNDEQRLVNLNTIGVLVSMDF